MAVYYKFKSAKDYDSIAIDGHFISVGNLKEKIFESKHLGRGTDFDLVVTNAQTNEEYLDEAMLIPKNTSVLIRRVPGRPRMPIVTQPVIEQDEPKVEISKFDDVQPAKSGFLGVDSSIMNYPDDSEWDEFGNDLYAIPEVLPVHQASNPIQDIPLPSKADEDSKIKALIDTPALDWQRQTSDGFGPGRGFGRGMGGRMMGGRGFGRGGLERKTPPQGYVCHRCKVPGHFIQHCPTNGDPNYDVKRFKPPTGIPKSMLMANPDGSYALPTGAVAVLKPNEAAFEKEIEGLPSIRSVGDLPPELHCPLCKEVMKDAVLTSKCCFTSFCDKCIRDHIISKSMCVCGATNILADDLLPNKTLRDTINRILESNNSSAENAGSAFQVQDMESKIPQPKMEPKVPSPTLSAASKGQQATAPQNEAMPMVKEPADQGRTVSAPQKNLEKGRMGKVPDVSEATHDSMSVREPASQGSAPLADEEVQQRPVSSEAAKKKKKKKPRLPLNAAEMQWKMSQDLAPENYMMPMGPSAYNPYWTGMQPGLEGYVAPYGGSMPYMGYGLGPLDIPFGVFPPDPFAAQGYMMPPIPPHRDLADFGMGLNTGPPIMSREEFEARKADLRRKREMERRGGEREFPRDRELSREVNSSGDVSSLKSKSKSIPQPSSTDHHRHRSERSSPERPAREPEIPRPSSKRKSDYDYDYDHRDRKDYHREHQHHHSHQHHRSESSAARSSSATLEPPPKSTSADRKQKVSVFSRISFPDEEQAAASKKRKLSSSEAPVGGSVASSGHHSHRAFANGYHEDHKTKAVSVSRKSSAAAATAATAVDYESSDDERHFKRKPSRYESSPPAAAAAEYEEGRHSRGSRERERDRGRDERDRGGYSKHR
ncbi:E3 ubiquitin ligase PARAQUAT TOLERANCE 3-like [Actinidia eriantha]|uniref:E3 ubiquitin ligase PARAQUAT TOLERANCE 3-like n=1 Tax=Actinidia eriantha TaxID=165200 RepID=UPI00258359D1|nr:E3 ubiquitin ligase PARAQUAT TOLERANCE 3-like [Actinidia eriantha]